MFDEFVLAANVDQLAEAQLSNYSTKFTACCGNTMGGRTITGGEGFSRHNESGCVGTKVLEEIGKAIEEDEYIFRRRVLIKLVISKAFEKE